MKKLKNCTWDYLMTTVEKIDSTPVLSNKTEVYYYCVALEGSTARVLDAYTGKTVVDVTELKDWKESNNDWKPATYKIIEAFNKWYERNKNKELEMPGTPEIDSYNNGDNDQPTTCPKCGGRTTFIEILQDHKQQHECMSCKYKFDLHFN